MHHLYQNSRNRYLETVLITLLMISAPGHAAVIDSYFGWNLCCDASVPAPLELTSITYFGGSGLTTTVVPAFSGPFGVGMPDVPTFIASPTFTSGGDGETTRTIGATMPIDWDLTSFSYPSIDIVEYTVFDGTATSVGGFPAGPYTVGLIPFGADTELSSSLGIFQGDIYDGLAGATGNPVALAGFFSGPLSGITAEMSFAAAEAAPVPVPPAIWLFGSALGLSGLLRRKGA